MFYILPQMLSFVAKIFVFPDFISHVVKQLDKKQITIHILRPCNEIWSVDR